MNCPRCRYAFTIQQAREAFLRCPSCGLKQEHKRPSARDRLRLAAPGEKIRIA